MSNGIEYSPLNGPELLSLRKVVVEVYSRAFSGPPYHKDESDSEMFFGGLSRHIAREGFRSVVAREAPEKQVVGFVYGYTCRPGNWWYDNVAPGLSQEAINEWLSNCFEFVELAVDPDFQGQGIGGQLHDRLLTGLRYRTAVLSTMSGTTAEKMYRKRGWVTLIPVHRFPGGSEPYLIMGLDLTRYKHLRKDRR